MAKAVGINPNGRRCKRCATNESQIVFFMELIVGRQR